MILHQHTGLQNSGLPSDLIERILLVEPDQPDVEETLVEIANLIVGRGENLLWDCHVDVHRRLRNTLRSKTHDAGLQENYAIVLAIERLTRCILWDPLGR